jgi:hypothetical protein
MNERAMAYAPDSQSDISKAVETRDGRNNYSAVSR